MSDMRPLLEETAKVLERLEKCASVECVVCRGGIAAHLARLRELLNEPVNQCEMPEVAAMRYIEQLRADMGQVTILCDDDDAVYKSEQMAIEVTGEWTDWKPRRFFGERVDQALAKAVVEHDASNRPNRDPCRDEGGLT